MTICIGLFSLVGKSVHLVIEMVVLHQLNVYQLW